MAKDEAQDFEGMLERMERLLADELATFEELKRGEGGPEGKAAVDLVALMAKTLEKIDVLRRGTGCAACRRRGAAGGRA